MIRRRGEGSGKWEVTIRECLTYKNCCNVSGYNKTKPVQARRITDV